MNEFILFLCLTISLAKSAPLYGEDGGYQGFASYVPLKNSLSRTGHAEDRIRASAGSPEISRRPSKEDTSAYVSDTLPKKYNVLDYTPSHQHGYGNNKVSEENLEAPYHRATIYGQENGGYKIADAYQNEHADDGQDKSKKEYSDDDYSNPQPYEYGYALKDEHGNSQHKHETSDGHGNVKGVYGFMDEHGLYRSVEYVAGKDGFKALVKTNEPGTENQNPADVKIEAESSSEYK